MVTSEIYLPSKAKFTCIKAISEYIFYSNDRPSKANLDHK